MAVNTTMTVDCPTCGEKVEWAEKNTFRPFCSLRCKHNDLSAWATEQYAIPAIATADAADAQEDDANHNGLPTQ